MPERLSDDLLRRVVRCRTTLGMGVPQTAELLELTPWRVKDVMRRHRKGEKLCTTGKHTKPRSGTKMTAAVRQNVWELFESNNKK